MSGNTHRSGSGTTTVADVDHGAARLAGDGPEWPTANGTCFRRSPCPHAPL